MAIVVRGLGLPEDGALVVGGLGVSEADLNAMSATLAGSSSLIATLTASGAAQAQTGGSTGRRKRQFHGYITRPIIVIDDPVAAPMRAVLVGTSRFTADITFTVDFDLDLETLLLAGVL